MIYRFSIKKVNRTLSYNIQTFWVDIDVKEDDKALDDKIIFGLQSIGVDTIYDSYLRSKGEIRLETIPFPSYPENAESQLLSIPVINMVTIRSYTTIEQSKVLAEILPFESVDMYYGYMEDKAHLLPYSDTEVKSPCTPCWSLAALLDVLPKIQGFKPIITLYYNYITYPHMSDLYTKADNLVDACYEMILKLHKLNLL